jgi:hypothetical protein
LINLLVLITMIWEKAVADARTELKVRLRLKVADPERLLRVLGLAPAPLAPDSRGAPVAGTDQDRGIWRAAQEALDAAIGRFAEARIRPSIDKH